MLGLIGMPGHIWLSISPVDLRRSIDGLSALVRHTLGQQPCAGSAFVFRNTSGNRIKVFSFEGIMVNAMEWLLANGVITVKGQERRVSELLFARWPLILPSSAFR